MENKIYTPSPQLANRMLKLYKDCGACSFSATRLIDTELKGNWSLKRAEDALVRLVRDGKLNITKVGSHYIIDRVKTPPTIINYYKETRLRGLAHDVRKKGIELLDKIHKKELIHYTGFKVEKFVYKTIQRKRFKRQFRKLIGIKKYHLYEIRK